MEKIDQSEILQNHTNSKALLPAWYYDAFAYKMAGLKYDLIAEKVGKSQAHVRSLFAKSGPLFKFWRDYVEQEKATVIEDSLDMFFGHLPDVARMTIIRAKEGKGMVGIEASRDIFSYTLGKPEQRLKLDAKVGIFNFTDWALAQAESIKRKKDAARNGVSANTTERSGAAAGGISGQS